MYKIQTLNNISVKGLERLPRDRYEVASEIGHPDAILVRSASMHDLVVPDTVLAIGRAGAGNAALLAAAIIGASRPEILAKLEEFRRTQTQRVLEHPDPSLPPSAPSA